MPMTVGCPPSSVTCRRRIPLELERTILVLALKNCKNSLRFLLVDKCAYEWLKKLFYYNVVLTSDTKALSFISTLRTEELTRAAVKALHLESSVSVKSCIRILQLCEGLEALSLHVPVFPRHTITSSFDSPAKPLLPHLYKFYKLKSLTINLSTIFVGDEAVYLPQVPLFERITHLHITNAWVLWGHSIGLESLANLTHLSLHISTLHVHVLHLRALLRGDRLQVLVLWRREPKTYNHVQCCLSSIHIRDARIVIMNSVLFREYTHEEHAFWDYVGAMVSWRKASMAKPFDINNSLSHEIFRFLSAPLYNLIH